jgi:hypothetical protein
MQANPSSVTTRSLSRRTISFGDRRMTEPYGMWSSSLPLTGVSSFGRAGTRLFAAETTGISTSDDNGASWTFSFFSDGAFSFSSDGSTIYLGSRSKVFKSTAITIMHSSTPPRAERGSIICRDRRMSAAPLGQRSEPATS